LTPRRTRDSAWRPHGRVEPFDVLAADQYAVVVTGREQARQPISISDAQIAAICRALNATLATRNTTDFTGTGVSLINPWKAVES
jgi:toxin FitB